HAPTRICGIAERHDQGIPRADEGRVLDLRIVGQQRGWAELEATRDRIQMLSPGQRVLGDVSLVVGRRKGGGLLNAHSSAVRGREGRILAALTGASSWGQPEGPQRESGGTVAVNSTRSQNQAIHAFQAPLSSTMRERTSIPPSDRTNSS